MGVSVTRKGMIRDIPGSNLDGTSYPFALNAAVEANSQDGIFTLLQNEGSNLLATTMPAGFIVVGKRKIHELNRTIYAIVNPNTGQSEIGEVLNCNYNDDTDDLAGGTCLECDFEFQREQKPLEKVDQTPYCPYETMVNADCLNFNIDYPVKIRYKITDCGVNIYFTDRLNQRRFMYFDYENGNQSDNLVLNKHFKTVVGFGECDEPVYSEDLDCNKISYHPDVEKPCIEFVDVVYGGNLRAGSYQFIFAYSDLKGNVMTDYLPATNIIPVFEKQITFDTNYRTDKAIHLKIRNIDKSVVYGYYNLIVAETVDSFTTFKLVGTFPVTQTNITYTGSEESLIEFTPEQIFQKRIYYKVAGAIADANDLLLFSDLEEFSKPNLQRVANKVELYWKTVAVPENIYREPRNTFNFRGFQRDEVIPFGLVFVKTTGEELGPYHVPGPSKQKFLSQYGVDVDAIVANNDVLEDTSCNDITRNKTWQVYNTARIIGTPHEGAPKCEIDKTWEWGEFAYWESIRTYPNDPEIWGELCGEPIRFHKTPDSRVTHIHDGLGGAKSFFDSNIIYPLGVRVDHQSVKDAIASAVTEGIITQAEADEISEYRIVRGNRVGNKSIIAKGLLFDMWDYTKNGVRHFYPNYVYNDLRDDDFISNNENTYQGGNNSNPIPNEFRPTRRYTFHSPDTHFNNPTIGSEIKLETEEYGTSEGFFNEAQEQAKYKFLSTFATTFAFAVGVASAFSAEKEKKTRIVTIKSERQWITAGTSPGAFAPLPIPGAVQGDLFAFNLTGASSYDETTGLPIIPHPLAAETHNESFKGTRFQLLNPLSGNPAGVFLQQAVFMAIIGLKEMQIINDLIKSLIPLKNFAIQYNSIGRYNNYVNVNNSGNKIRAIERSAYLEPMIQLVNESINEAASQFTNIYINNWNRERSVYLKTDIDKPAFPNPSVADTSRFTMDMISFDQGDLNERFYAPISSYYASIKNFVPDQYGDVTDVNYLETNSCTFKLSEDYTTSEDGVYGGDTFINRFGLKRKMPFFLQTRFRALDETDVRYSELGNVGYPNYYFNVNEPLLERLAGNTFGGNIFNFLTDILGVANTRLDAKKQKVFYQSGFIHLYHYGIPFFLAESDVNVDFRHGENNLEKDFYPHQQDLGFWFQEKNVPITEDNYFFYNKTYSKQNKESFIDRQVTELGLECTVKYPGLIVVSEQTTPASTFDNWLLFRSNNMYRPSASLGRTIGLDGIEGDKVLARFENTSLIFNAYHTLELSDDVVQVGTGGMFNTAPKQFAAVDLGYAGSQHTDMIKTEYGHIWTDAKRGQVFHLLPNAKGLEELGKDGMRNWFKENLPFQLLKDFPALGLRDADNNFKGIGLHLSFDKRFNRFFLTKLDYKKINSAVTYNATTKTFQVAGKDVELTDKRYFCNRSWTISYNLATKTWVSFHSFTPKFFVDDVDYFQSGVDSSGTTSVWSHNVSNKSYQVYYGELYPFIIEVLSNPTHTSDILNSVEYDCDVIRYHNLYDYAYNRMVTFNKAVVYNDRACSGLLELVIRNEEDMNQSHQYPKVINGVIQVLTTNRDNKWSFNQFYDTVNLQTGNVPFFKNDCNNVDKTLYTKALNYFKPDINKQPIRGRQHRIKLINDKYSNYKFVFNLLQDDKTRMP